MPRQRLSWFKLWVGATRHEKVVTLDDRSFRAWIELLDAASEQPIRGRFTSCAAAAAIIRRPPALVRRLAEARLIDEREDGVWLHDWPEWQRWRPEDTPPESPPNGTGKTHESQQNGSAITHESHANNSPPRVERAKTEKKSKSKDVDGEEDLNVSLRSTTAAFVFDPEEKSRIDDVTQVLAEFGFSGSPQFWRRVIDKYGVLDLEAEALKQADWMRRNRKRTCTELRYLNWLEIASRKEPHGTTRSSAQTTPPDDGRFAAFRKFA